MTDYPALIRQLLEALEEERRIRILGQSPECGIVHWESIRDLRRRAYENTDVAITAARAALEAPQEREMQDLLEQVKDFPRDYDGEPIIYDTNEVDDVTHALTGDEGEDDSITVLRGLARYVQNVWPGKNAREVLIEYEECRLAAPVQPPKQEPCKYPLCSCQVNRNCDCPNGATPQPQPAIPQGTQPAMGQFTLTEDGAERLTWLLATDGGEGKEITLSIGMGHSGFGLYAWEAEYPEEGATFIETTSKPELFAAPPSPANPQGWKLVPLEPTGEMLEAMARYAEGFPNARPLPALWRWTEVYSAALSASLTPAQPQEPSA